MPLPVCIPFGWRCVSWVEVLDKSQCNLKEVPPEVVRWSATLRELYLDGNQITDLNKGVMECYALRKLSVGQNRLLQLPKGIKNLKVLQELSLFDNELSELPMELEYCSSLRVLDLRLNVFTRLPSVLTNMASLLHLSLYDTALASLPNDFGKLTNLSFLDLRENHLHALPAAIGQLKNLRHLDIGKNELAELPFTVGELDEIEELYVDNNYLTELPRHLMHCQKLQILDISGNEIKELPTEFGEFKNLTELMISNNEITELPHSFGHLTKLHTLSACTNKLTQLTPTIGGCESLTELRLARNKIKEVPDNIGNLKNLEILALDENRLVELSPAIGKCLNLKFLTLRNNELRELPFEIGRLENIRVLDVAENRLLYLPYSISVPSKLRALWLSIDQKIPLPRLTITQLPISRVKVLTCYLLPQGKCQVDFTRHTSKSSYGVSFNDNANDEDAELGQFQRRGTPHPKSRNRSSIPRKISIDGHYVVRGENSDDAKFSKKPQKDNHTPAESAVTKPKAELKLEQFNEIEVKEIEKKPILRGVIHAKKCSDNSEKSKFFSISRHSKRGFGISIAGGRDSKPYKEGDSGIFISKVIVGSPAEAAGLLPGDKIIFFNGVDIRNEYHKVVIDMMRKISALELVIMRGQNSDRKQKSPCVHHENENSGEISAPNTCMHPVQKNVLVHIPYEADCSWSFSMSTRESKHEKGKKEIIIGSLKFGGAAETCGKISVGDRVLSINGVEVTHFTLQQAESLLNRNDSDEIFLVLQKCSCRINDVEHKALNSTNIVKINEKELETERSFTKTTEEPENDSGETLIKTTGISFQFHSLKEEEVEEIDARCSCDISTTSACALDCCRNLTDSTYGSDNLSSYFKTQERNDEANFLDEDAKKSATPNEEIRFD